MTPNAVIPREEKRPKMTEIRGVGLQANDGDVTEDEKQYANATLKVRKGNYNGLVMVARATVREPEFGFPSNAMALRMTKDQAVELIAEIAKTLAAGSPALTTSTTRRTACNSSSATGTAFAPRARRRPPSTRRGAGGRQDHRVLHRPDEDQPRLRRRAEARMFGVSLNERGTIVFTDKLEEE